jgi:diaminopimelate decarboxylase/aspartate kinase
LTVVIDEADADGLLPVLHAELIESEAMPVRDASVFGPSWHEIEHGRPQRAAPWWQGERERLLERAAEGTPVYVYHLPTLRERARSLLDVEAIDRRYFAIKANPHPALLRALVAEGFGLECVSLGELEHVFATLPDLDPARVLFTPSFAPRAEYEAAFALGVTVTLDNVEALHNWPETFRGRALWLRIDLGRGDGHHAKVVTGGAASKFGLPLAAFDAFVAEAQKLDVRIAGIHAHLGSGIVTPAHWREVYAELAGFADSVGTVDTIDIGGGLPIPYKPDAHPFDIAAWAAGLAEIKAAYPRYALAVEPGRYLVAECGVLLAHVTQVVEKQGIRRVGLDAGMNALMRPALYEAYHGIHNLSRLDEGGDTAFDVVGPICESGDVLGAQRMLPAATREGDAVLVADAGAYGFVMANRYNLRALPREDVLE